MDRWLFYDVTHALHTYCNPIRARRTAEIGRVLGLKPQHRVLDIACGHGELLVSWAAEHGISGVGVDASPYAIERAKRRATGRNQDDNIVFVLALGEEYRPPRTERFDVTTCIGASWIWGAYDRMLEALVGFTRPGGLLVVGQPHWITDPPEEYLLSRSIQRQQFHTLWEHVDIAREMDLRLIYMAESSREEWDRYEMLQAAAVDRFEQEHANHPDLEEIRAQSDRAREAYLRWGRECVGFAIYVFRTPEA
jgi:cyclopropane fatty-acyl-phospholipid synthase-like methyltransferase